MSDTDSLDYLQPGYDPSSLTVPRIRSILVSHQIPFPSGAKKPQLIEIFTDKVLPQSRKILSARDRARRTSAGITNADVGQSATADDEDLMPPPPTPRARSTRKPSSRIKAEESESDVSSNLRSPMKRTPRASKYSKASDTETGTDVEVKKSVRKSRKSEAPVAAIPAPILPKPKREEIDDGAGVFRRAEERPDASRRQSNFSYDNPFQSGSSPPTDVSSGERPRKSTGSSKDLAKRKSTSTPRRRTDGNGRHTAESFEIPVSEWSSKQDPVQSIEPSEEFTPEEQLELTREQALTHVDPLPPRPRTQSRGIGKGPIWMVLLTLLGGYATWYRQEKIAVGYCGVGRDAHAIVPANIQVPEWFKILVEPECELCPQHAYCGADLSTQCETDFILKSHPLSIGGLIPFTPTCEPDGEKVRRVKVVADRAIEELRERRAKFECGELVDDAGVPEAMVEIDAEELKKEVSKKRRKGMGKAEFEELWSGAIGEIEGREEVEHRADGLRTLLSSTSLARLPLGCAIRRSFRLSLAAHRLQIATLALLLAIFFYVRSVITSYTSIRAQVPHLVSLTLDRLASQAALHAADKESYPENWISIGQLRDDVLRDEHSVAKREKLWKNVRPIVEMNANVRSSQRESRSGEISRVWEWIGAVDGESSRQGLRKSGKGGRVSWGAYDENSSPVSGMDGGPKWEEARPIY